MRRSYLIAFGIALAVTLWLASGQPAVQRLVTGEPATDAAEGMATAAPVDTAAALPRVRVVLSRAQSIDREIVIHGRTEPNRDVVLRAETYGRIGELLFDKGELVAAGEPILRLDAREREAQVAQAQALVSQRELEFHAASRLGERGFQAETQVAATAADLEAARAELRTRQVELENTIVLAPFSGLLADRMVEIGDFVEIGDSMVHLMEQDPFLVTGEVAETQRRLIRPGMNVHIELADGQRHDGTLTFVSATANEATRTFTFEVEIANPDGRIPAGMSATSRLRFAEIEAHRLSAGVLTLDGDHRLGVNTVDEDDRVRFVPVEVVRADADAVWLAGLPPAARVIIVGQGFVHDGDHVVPVPVESSADAAPRRETPA